MERQPESEQVKRRDAFVVRDPLLLLRISVHTHCNKLGASQYNRQREKVKSL